MMTIDRGPRGADIFTLKPIGWGRVFEIPFLALWLSFWVVGEGVAVTLLGAILGDLIARALGVTLSFSSRLAPDGSAPFFLLFLLFWLTMWTLGGIAAGTHFLRALAGRDVISVSPDGLEIEWRAGPFRRRRTIKRGDIRRVRLNLQGNTVVVDFAGGTADITNYGTREDRAAILDSLKKQLVLPDEAQAKRLDAETVPPEWDVEVQGMETRIFTPTRRTRRIVAAILWGLAAMVVITGLLSASRVTPDLLEIEPVRRGKGINFISGATTGGQIAAAGAAALFGLWATWVTWGRSEWVVGHGRMTWRRKFGSWRNERSFDDAKLEIERTYDSDGDARFTLRVRSATAHRQISSAINESADLLRLAQWLSARTRFPID
jgi:hypothetical protein